MEEYVVYIMRSERHNKIYKGCAGNLIERFRSHNSLNKKGWTLRFRPWKVVFVRFFTPKKEAILFEKFLKIDVGREWIEGNIDFSNYED